MGRPHKHPEKGALANRVTVRMSAQDLEHLAEMAEHDGMSVAEWVRHAAMGTASLPESKRTRLMAGAAT